MSRRGGRRGADGRCLKSHVLLSLVLALQAVPAALDHGAQPQTCAAGAWRRFHIGQPASAVAACALAVGGEVRCWGDNRYGQLGRGDTAMQALALRTDGALATVDLGTGKRAQQITAGCWHTCALLADGGVKCWGLNNWGQLGYEDKTDRGRSASEMGDNLPLVNVGAGRTVREVVASSHSTFAILTSGRAVGWGRNDVGQLGYGHWSTWGDESNEMGPYLETIDFGTRCVDGTCTPLRVLQIAAGGLQMDDSDPGVPGSQTGMGHTCALLDDGNGQNGLMKCFGFNSMAQLGIEHYEDQGDDFGEMGNNLPFVDAGSGTSIEAVGVGGLFTCVAVALTGSQGGVKCWGINENGQLGIGHRMPRGGSMGDTIEFTDIGNMVLHGAVRQVVSGASHSCALLVTGKLKCWGKGGLLGNGHGQDVGDEPGEMGSNLSFVDIVGFVTNVTTRAWHTCVLLATGEIQCFGDNSKGQLGLEDTDSRGARPGEMGTALHAVAVFSPCEQCPDGSTSPPGSVRKSQCVCMPGYSGPVGDDHACVPCGNGTYNALEGQEGFPTVCELCEAGKYASMGGSTCVDCFAHSSSVPGSTNALFCKCNAGYSGEDGGTCVACAPGFYKDVLGDSPCVRCPVGKHSQYIATASQSDCTDCPENYYPADNSSVCVSCPKHTYSTAGSNSSIDCICNPGYSGPRGGPCAPCPVDTYNDDSDGQCDSCPPHSSSNVTASAHRTTCLCVEGFFGPEGGPCLECPANFYKDTTGTLGCVQCPPDKRSNPSSRSISDCTCREGMRPVSITAGVIECQECPQDTFKNHSANIDCTQCPSNSTAPIGASSVNECVCNAGFQGPSGGPCTPCAANTFKSETGPGDCLVCPSNFAAGEGSTRCGCEPGYFGSIDVGDCVACDANTYKAVSGSPCLPCPEHSSSPPASGSISFCVCNAGSEGPNGGPCVLCEVDTYKSQVGAAECQQCPEDMVTDGVRGATTVQGCKCKPGYSGPDGLVNLQTQCTACPAGKYKDVVGSSMCTNCSRNTYSGASGVVSSSSCHACINGQSPPGSVAEVACVCNAGFSGPGDACVACAPGTYKTSPGSHDCSICPGQADPALLPQASTSIDQCSPAIQCLSSCEPSFYRTDAVQQNVEDNCACVPCPTCPKGFERQDCGKETIFTIKYSDVEYFSYSGTCVECSTGKYAANESNMPCQPCVVCKQRMRSECMTTANRVCESESFFKVWLAMSKETFEGKHPAATSEASTYSDAKTTVRQAFRASVAEAASVDIEHVKIYAVRDKRTKSRRLPSRADRRTGLGIEVWVEILVEGNTPAILPIEALNTQLDLRGLPQVAGMDQFPSREVPEFEESKSNVWSSWWFWLVMFCSMLFCGCIAAIVCKYRQHRSHDDLEQGNPEIGNPIVEASFESYSGDQAFTDKDGVKRISSNGAEDRDNLPKERGGGNGRSGETITLPEGSEFGQGGVQSILRRLQEGKKGEDERGKEVVFRPISAPPKPQAYEKPLIDKKPPSKSDPRSENASTQVPSQLQEQSRAQEPQSQQGSLREKHPTSQAHMQEQSQVLTQSVKDSPFGPRILRSTTPRLGKSDSSRNASRADPVATHLLQNVHEVDINGDGVKSAGGGGLAGRSGGGGGGTEEVFVKREEGGVLGTNSESLKAPSMPDVKRVGPHYPVPCADDEAEATASQPQTPPKPQTPSPALAGGVVLAPQLVREGEDGGEAAVARAPKEEGSGGEGKGAESRTGSEGMAKQGEGKLLSPNDETSSAEVGWRSRMRRKSGIHK